MRRRGIGQGAPWSKYPHICKGSRQVRLGPFPPPVGDETEGGLTVCLQTSSQLPDIPPFLHPSSAPQPPPASPPQHPALCDGARIVSAADVYSATSTVHANTNEMVNCWGPKAVNGTMR